MKKGKHPLPSWWSSALTNATKQGFRPAPKKIEGKIVHLSKGLVKTKKGWKKYHNTYKKPPPDPEAEEKG